MQQQELGVKPPEDGQMPPSLRLANDRRQKSSTHADPVQKCPRCDSLNTKFCYYNNYSLSQPRHFCKNCRRYWTKGGALRNVPIGGGCRKNKRVKQRSADPSSLASLDESTSGMLANINSGNCSPLLPNFSGSSSSAFNDLSNESHRLNLTFSRLQESMRLGEQSGAAPSSQGLFSLGPGSSPIPASLLNTSGGQASALINNMPAFDTSLITGLSYSTPTPNPEQPAMYHGSNLSSFFETPSTHMGVAAPPSLEDHLSSYSAPSTGSSMDSQMRYHQNRVALQMVNDGQVEDQRRVFRVLDEETQESMRRIKGKSILSSLGDVRSMSEWQGMTENLLESASEGNFWGNTSWPEMHAALAGSTAGALLH